MENRFNINMEDPLKTTAMTASESLTELHNKTSQIIEHFEEIFSGNWEGKAANSFKNAFNNISNQINNVNNKIPDINKFTGNVIKNIENADYFSNSSEENNINNDLKKISLYEGHGLVQGIYETSNSNWNYYIYEPEYADDSTPLIVYLHGVGEVGNNISKLSGDTGFISHINNGSEYNAFILTPQLPQQVFWYSEQAMPILMSLIDETVEKYGINRDKICLAGFSLGADSIPEIIRNNPGYFSSSVIMSIDKPYVNSNCGESFKDVSTYILYGKNDRCAYGCEPLYTTINNAGGHAEIKSYDAQAHPGTVGRVLDDPNLDIIEWVRNQ